jgi:hypothetical protein
MGMPSFMDDIQRARDEAIHFRRLLRDNALLDVPAQKLVERARQQIPILLSVLNGAIEHFDKILEIATDPSMDLAEEVLRMKVKVDDTNKNAEARIAALQHQIETQKNTAALSKRNFRDELEKREQVHKRQMAEVTKRHVQELEKQKSAHQIEKNGWQKELKEYKSRSIAMADSEGQSPKIASSDLEFASAVRSFEPSDEDIR